MMNQFKLSSIMLYEPKSGKRTFIPETPWILVKDSRNEDWITEFSYGGYHFKVVISPEGTVRASDKKEKSVRVSAVHGSVFVDPTMVDVGTDSKGHAEGCFVFDW